MKADAALPPNERERLSALQRYQILDTPPDGAFDHLTAVAANLFRVPIAIVSLVDHDRIWFKSHHGLGLCEVLQNAVERAVILSQGGPPQFDWLEAAKTTSVFPVASADITAVLTHAELKQRERKTDARRGDYTRRGFKRAL